MRECDLVVVGAGLAGLTAAMYGARYGIETLLVDQMGAGGQILNAERIENFPGFPEGIAGYDLGPLVQEQAENAGSEFVMDRATELLPDDGDWIVKCDETELRARAVILAAGSTLRRLGIPGEDAYFGKGVSNCATCDGPLFHGDEVCVIGGGDSAVDEALVLTQYTSSVVIFHRGAELGAQQALLNRLNESSVEVVLNATVEGVLGEDEAVTAVRVRDNGTTRDHATRGVFVYVGLEPNTAWLQGVVDLDPAGHVATDLMMRTSAPGIFAAGDIRQHSVRQLVASAGDGATAAIAASRFLKGR